MPIPFSRGDVALWPLAAHAVPYPYAYWCVVRDGYDFIYIYGTVAECAAVVSRRPPEDCLLKGGSASLDDIRGQAEAAAAHLREVYADVGQAQALPATACLSGGLPRRQPPRRTVAG